MLSFILQANGLLQPGFTNPEVFLWPMPEGKPLDTLPYDELLNRLGDITNMRVVPDNKASNGYRIEYARFPGLEKVPNW